ncbi:hypothetical protein [Cesiribacter sp. SM1]|uniref:hypothetical protein n=1 Tax=Cesiribacter sp. SM1 TaxID=2861196 RepID=UPI001CD662A2|nr:hypothetical protein [Cesiribacter sp. SM1]
MNKLTIASLLFLALSSCTANEGKEGKSAIPDQEWGTIPLGLKDSLIAIAPQKQLFEINPAAPNTIVGEKGTTIIIPKNAIVDQLGNAVTGTVSIQLKENFSMADYVLSNLQTVHHESILETKGMIYLAATDRNGNSLKIANDKSIRIEIPQDELNKNAKIFLGNREEAGLINWDKIEEPAKTLIPYPIRFISENRFPTECSNHYGITTDTLTDKYYNYYGKLTDYENTLLATKEFAERYHTTCWNEVLEIYINNLEKNLWEIDELVIEHFIKDSIEEVSYYLNNPPPKVNGQAVTKEQWKARKWLIENAQYWGHLHIEQYKYFASQKFTRVDTTKLIDASKVKDLNTAFMAYDAMNFGWINVDYFYEDPKAVPVKLLAKTNAAAPIINLIFKDRNIILAGSEQQANEYRFTRNTEGYNKLPKGEKAIIVAIGYEGSSLTYGEKEITIGENEQENIVLATITGEALKNKLMKYGN